MFKNLLGLTLLASVFTSFNSNAGVVWNEYRVQMKKMVVKNHRPVLIYREAREYLMQEIHLDKDRGGYYIEDVYCHKTIRSKVGPNRMPNHTVINVEHTWPQSRFNRNFPKHIQKSDLHHLYPTDSRANGTRGNSRFTEVSSGSPATHDCDDSYVGRRGFEPPEDHKGNVARALFYFSIRYDIEISAEEEAILRKWNNIDPPDAAEKRRNDIIAKIQGNRNPFIDDAEYADIITNF
jgi:deoxyribonuclease-1